MNYQVFHIPYKTPPYLDETPYEIVEDLLRGLYGKDFGKQLHDFCIDFCVAEVGANTPNDVFNATNSGFNGSNNWWENEDPNVVIKNTPTRDTRPGDIFLETPECCTGSPRPVAAYVVENYGFTVYVVAQQVNWVSTRVY